MSIEDALEIIRKSIQSDDNAAWDALDVITAALEKV
jgi:hypothetical protein